MAHPAIEGPFQPTHLFLVSGEPGRGLPLPDGTRLATGKPRSPLVPGLPILYVEERDRGTAVTRFIDNTPSTLVFPQTGPEGKVANVYFTHPNAVLLESDFVDHEPSLIERTVPGAVVRTRARMTEAFGVEAGFDSHFDRPLFEERRGGLSRLNANVVFIERPDPDELAVVHYDPAAEVFASLVRAPSATESEPMWQVSTVTRPDLEAIPEPSEPPAPFTDSSTSQEQASGAEDDAGKPDILVDIEGDGLIVTVGTKDPRRITGGGVRSFVEPLLRRAGQAVPKAELRKSFVGSPRSINVAMQTAREMFNGDESLGELLKTTVVRHGSPRDTESTIELVANVTFSESYLKKFPLQTETQSEPIRFGIQTPIEKPVVEVIARAETTLERHVWTAEEEQQVSRVIGMLGYGPDQMASLLSIANVIWPDEEITELTSVQLNTVLRTVNKARYKIRNQKERVIVPAYKTDDIRGYYFGEAEEGEETAARMFTDFPDDDMPTSLNLTFGELKKSNTVRAVIAGIRKTRGITSVIEIAKMIWPDANITELDEVTTDRVHTIVWASQAKVASNSKKTTKPLMAAHRPEIMGYYYDKAKLPTTDVQTPRPENIVFLEDGEAVDDPERLSVAERRVGLPTVGIALFKSEEGNYLEVHSYANWKEDRHVSLLDDVVAMKLFAYLGLHPNQTIEESTLRDVVNKELSQPESLPFSTYMSSLIRRVEGHIPGALISVRGRQSCTYELKANVKMYQGNPDTGDLKPERPNFLSGILKTGL